MINVTCYACHKLGHIATYCQTKIIDFNQQKLQKLKRLPQANKWRGQPFTRYTNRFHGYCFCCKGFGHKAMECRTYGQRKMFKTSRIFMNNGEFTHIDNPFRNIIKCFNCHQIDTSLINVLSKNVVHLLRKGAKQIAACSGKRS